MSHSRGEVHNVINTSRPGKGKALHNPKTVQCMQAARKQSGGARRVRNKKPKRGSVALPNFGSQDTRHETAALPSTLWEETHLVGGSMVEEDCS